LGLLIVGLVVLQETISYLGFLIGASVIGLGSGLYPTAARALISDLFVSRRGKAFGIHTASGDIGNAAAAGLAITMVTYATWHTAFTPLILLSGVALFGIHLFDHEKYVFKTVNLHFLSTCRRLFSDARKLRLLIAYALASFAWQSVTGFLPIFLQIDKNFSITLSSVGFAAMFIIGTLAKPLAGSLGDRFGHGAIATICLFLAGCGLGSLLVVKSTLPIFVFIGVFSMGIMAFPPVMQALFMNIVPDDSMGGDLGAIRTLYIGLGSLGPSYVGYIASIDSYTLSFAGLIVCLFLSAGIIIRTSF
jgi:MFS family permease